MNTEAELGVTWSQAKDCLGRGSWKRPGAYTHLEPSGGHSPAHTWISDFRLQTVRESLSVLSHAECGTLYGSRRVPCSEPSSWGAP